MANLAFCDKHNMVAYLQKSEGKQFWQTAFVSTLENGEMEITATIDGKIKVVSEASIRRHLKLEDSDGISTLPIAENFEQLALIGNIATAIICLATNRTLNFSKLIFEAMGEGSTIPVESHHTPTSAPSTSQPPTSSPSMQTIHAAPMPHDSHISRVYSHGSNEGSLTLNELMVLCTQLSIKVEGLEEDLKQTKKLYGNAYTKLILKVKKLEKTVKTSQARKRAKIVVSDDKEDEEDSSKQGRNQGRFDDTNVCDQPEEQLGVFSAAKVLADAARIRRGVENIYTYTRRRTVSTSNGGVSAASGLSEPTMKIKKRVQIQMSIDEELAQKLHEEEQARFNAEQEAKFNEEQEQERLDYEAAVRIREELDESERVAADEDLVQQLQADEKYSEEDLPRKLMELVNQKKKFFSQQRAKAKINKPMTHAQQKAYMSTYIKNQEGGYSIKKLKSLSFEEVKEIFETTMRRVQSFVPMDSELEDKRLKRADEEPKADELSQEQLQQLIIIVPEEGMNVEALQTKYLITDWEVY
ncbi:hypothetical protein Tco_0386139 [Tanacetum coccineum]